MLACLIYGSDQTTCIGYLNMELVIGLFAAFAVLFGLSYVFKIVLRLMGY